MKGMFERVFIEKKENGFVLVGEFPDPEAKDKELIVEGKDPKKIGAAVLAMFQKPRGPRKRPGPKAVA